MPPELLYFVSIALFGFVILGAAQLPNDMWLVAAIFPVFIAMIVGFMMWVYAWSEFGLTVSIGALVVPIAAAVAGAPAAVHARSVHHDLRHGRTRPDLRALRVPGSRSRLTA